MPGDIRLESSRALTSGGYPARVLLAVVLVVGIPMSWNVRPYEDVGFLARARQFERAAPGTVVEIPVNPRGWSFRLERK